jgi:hypothetical protein
MTRKIKKSERNIMFMLFDNARNKQVSLKSWVNYILKDNGMQFSLTNKLTVQKYLAGQEVFNLMLPHISNKNIYELATDLFNDKDILKQLSLHYLEWRSNNSE